MEKESLSSHKWRSILIFLLLMCVFFILLVLTSKKAAYNKSIMADRPSVVHSYHDDDGNLVQYFDDNTEAVYYDDGKVILKDYEHVLSQDNANPVSAYHDGFVLLGKVFLDGECYLVSGKYVTEHSPEYEPHSSDSGNQGYWIYEFRKA